MDVQAGASDTITIFADATFATLNTFAGIGDALAFDTLFAGVAGDGIAITSLAGIFDTFSVFAKFLGLAFNASTRGDALAIATELIRIAVDSFAGIVDTDTFFTDVVFVGTTLDVTIVFDTNPFVTDLA